MQYKYASVYKASIDKGKGIYLGHTVFCYQNDWLGQEMYGNVRYFHLVEVIAADYRIKSEEKQHISENILINILFLISKRHTIDAFAFFMTFQYRGETQTYTQYGYICIWVYLKCK